MLAKIVRKWYIKIWFKVNNVQGYVLLVKQARLIIIPLLGIIICLAFLIMNKGMNKMAYKDLVEEILKNVGGKENIAGLTHCITRLRFKFKR